MACCARLGLPAGPGEDSDGRADQPRPGRRRDGTAGQHSETGGPPGVVQGAQPHPAAGRAQPGHQLLRLRVPALPVAGIPPGRESAPGEPPLATHSHATRAEWTAVVCKVPWRC
eukprot:scaffold96236_cov29-Prasinocladus_malaysianus.AAC.1